MYNLPKPILDEKGNFFLKEPSIIIIEAEEAAALKNSFQTDILKPISQEGKAFRDAVAARKKIHNITKEGE